MTSLGSIIVAYTRTFTPVYSFIGMSRKYKDFWAAQEDRETDTKRERERKFCVYSECASPYGKKDEETEDEAVLTAKAMVLL